MVEVSAHPASLPGAGPAPDGGGQATHTDFTLQNSWIP
jgi:hypothetical protein